MQPRFEYYKGKDGWRWRLRAGNSEIIASGEAYADACGVKGGIDVVRVAAAAAEKDPKQVDE